jgi:ribonuclease MRP protein subunit RMP1
MATTPTPKEELTSISQTLHLFHHRNHNQHRLAKWYKSLSQLRRHISKLILELETLDTAITYSSKNEESKYVRAAREKVEDRVEFMENWLEKRCYIAFSNLVADNQYAALGLFLIGTLARVRSVIRSLGKERVEDEEVEEEEVVKTVLEENELRGGKEERYDFGEVVRREDLVNLNENTYLDGRGDSEVKLTKKRKSLLQREEGVELQIPAKRVKAEKRTGSERLKREDDGESGVDLKRSKKAKGEDLVEDQEDGESALVLTASKVKWREPEKGGPAEGIPSRGSTKTKKKKKRKKGDAFDDLFDSLI